MYTYKLAKSLTLAAFLATTAATASFSESSASLQAGSSSSTMNNAQAARETSTQASTQNNSQSSTDQGSQASTQNNSNGSSEAVGGTLNTNNRSTLNTPPVVGAGARAVNSNTSSSRTVSTAAVVPARHTPRSVTRSYRWNSASRKRSFSKTYMTKTIHQAAVTR
jgi:hypothetical protein